MMRSSTAGTAILSECRRRYAYLESGEPAGTSLGASEMQTYTAERSSLAVSLTKSAEEAEYFSCR